MRDTLLRIDEKAVVWLSIRRNPALDTVMKWATRTGDGPLWICVSLVAAVTVPAGIALFSELAVAFSLNFLVYKLLKSALSRPRPFERILIVEPAMRAPDRFSFPSGHTAAACVMVAVLGTAFSFLVVPLACLAVLIGTSRVYLGMHYPSDVLAGAVLGLGSGISSHMWFSFVA